MPINGFIAYILSKRKKEIQRDDYIMDCLWSMATDMRFKDKNKPTLLRWHEIKEKTEIKEKPKIDSGRDILNELLNTWN